MPHYGTMKLNMIKTLFLAGNFSCMPDLCKCLDAKLLDPFNRTIDIPRSPVNLPNRKGDFLQNVLNRKYPVHDITNTII